MSRRDRALRKVEKAPDGRGLCGGPWEVELVAGDRLGQPGHPAYAVVRRARPVAEGGGTVAVYGSYADALHTAAVLPALGAGNHLWLGPQRPPGVTVHDGRSFLGHVAGQGPAASPDLPLCLHVARHFAGNLDSLALLHRSLGWQALALLGREMMRRLT